MKINRKKRKGGLATIIITLVLIALVIVCIPYFKKIVNSTAQGSNNISEDIVNITSDK